MTPADVVPVVVLIALGLVPDSDGSGSVMAALLVPLPLLLRRRWPVPVFGVTVAFAFAWMFVQSTSVTDPDPTTNIAGALLSTLLALYTVAAGSSTVLTAAAAVVTEVGVIIAVVLYGGKDWLNPWIGLTGLVVAAAAWGVGVRRRRELVASLREHAASLELERDQEAMLATAAERARIAREMHDIIAHNLAVMVSLADGAANVARRSPERAERATIDIATTGRHALVEMRRLLGVLPEEGPEMRTPQPGLERISELVDTVRAAGMPVTVRRFDVPDFTPSPGLQLAVYRIVQESLTNALKHGGGNADAAVSIKWEGRRVTVEVTNTGAATGPPGVGGGITGMRDRAAAFNGSVNAGANGDGGWKVLVVLSDDALGASR